MLLIDSLPEVPDWSFGGGTSLLVHLGHRHSYDIDVFVGSSAVVRALSPNRNPATKALLDGRRYDYPGHYLKLHLDQGEIDFLIGTKVSDIPSKEWEFEGRMLLIDTPWETAAKKLFYRPSTLKVRDVFDIAAVIGAHPDELRAALPDVEEKLPLAIDRVDAMLDKYEELAVKEINATASGHSFLRREAADSVLSFLRDWQHRSHP